jgi:hypothetical protein
MVCVATTFVVEDDFHAELMGQFPDRSSATAFLEQLKANPSAMANRPPCTSWPTDRLTAGAESTPGRPAAVQAACGTIGNGRVNTIRV